MLNTSVESKDGKLDVTYECDPCGTHEMKTVQDAAKK
jgi:hypothetical protein